MPRIRLQLPATILLLLLPQAATMAGSPGRMLTQALRGPMADVEEIVFAVRAPGRDGHWYANFGYWADDENKMMYGPDGGRLCRLNLRTGKMHILLGDPGGSMRDPHVHYDGQKILFSYRKARSKHYHLYEINIDGSGLRQLTDGLYDDLEGIYLPDGDILFCSSRCHRWVQCWHTHVAIRYRCNGDGGNIRVISSNVEQDNTPWMLPDGRVLYMRWEYVDRSRVKFHHLWTSNPDGTAEMIYFGNQHPGTVMLDAKPIPGSDKVVAVFSPGHGRKEHAGQITLVDAKAGPDARSHTQFVGGNNHRDPYPFSENCFLVAANSRLLLMDGQGRTEVVYELPDKSGKYWCHEPRPIRPRPRERIISSRVDRGDNNGCLILADVNHGRSMAGVKPGEIKKLLVMETLPKPINHSGTMEPISHGGTFTLPRILGTVPVEPDGSAHFEVPALRSLFFIALDENDLSVKRMQSFVNVMPGETTSCVGCHEHRADTVRPIEQLTLMALDRPPSKIRPIVDAPDVFDFPRDIQPILDEHCVKCHGYATRPDGDFPLVGARGPWFSHSYYALMSRGLVSHGRDSLGDIPPREIGSSASRMMKLVDGSHYDAKPSPRQWKFIRLWIESGAPYAGTYAALGTGSISIRPPPVLLRGRCAQCHRIDKSTEMGKLTQHVSVVGHRYASEVQYNLTNPTRSPILLAPLSRSAGGWGLCRDEPFDGRRKPLDAKPAPPANVFASTDDPDYQKLLADIQEAKADLDRIQRFDMPNFRPSRHYIREMRRFGILDESFDAATGRIDVYQTDRAYWKSLWHQPTRS